MANLKAKPELSESHRAYVDSLRDLATWLEDHPDLIPWSGLDVAWWGLDKANCARLVRKMGRATKNVLGDNLMEYKREFGPHKVSLNISREKVCKRVVVGTKEVTREVPQTYATITETVDVYEWQCEPVLGDEPPALPQGIEVDAVTV